MRSNGFMGAGVNSQLGAFNGYKALMLTKPDKKNRIHLVSPHQGTYLLHGKESKCNKILGHRKDMAACTCGYHGYKTLAEGKEHLKLFQGSPYVFLTKVKLSGETAVYEKGYRSTQQRLDTIQIIKCGFYKNKCSLEPTKFISRNGLFGNLLSPLCLDCFDELQTYELLHKYKVYEINEISEILSLDGFSPVNIINRNYEINEE